MGKELKDILRDLRETQGLSLRDAEGKSGISNAYISQLESGKIQNPSPHMLHKLAKAYNVPYQTLMEAAGYLKPGSKNTEATKTIVLSATEELNEEEMEGVMKYIKFLRSQRK